MVHVGDGSGQTGYAGDVSVDVAYAGLADNPAAALVDCRTTAEWTFVGLPDLGALSKTPVLVEWQSFPAMTVNPDFAAQVSRALTDSGTKMDAPVYFLCRSGTRSRAAAIAMSGVGYGQCYNISGGFEGDLDTLNHRGGTTGWKAAGLPWVQT